MNIVVLDGYTLNPGDISWTELHSLGSCFVNPRTDPGSIARIAAKAEIVLTNKCEIRAETLAQLPALRYIGVLATGYNVVDVVAARSQGVTVTNVPDYGTRAVAQHTFALLLDLTNHVGQLSNGTRAGQWTAAPDWCYWNQPLVELAGLTLGVIGYGRIGRAVADLGRAFGMDVLVHSRRRVQDVERTDLDDIFTRSDVVTLHCPLTVETRHLVNATRLNLMKPSAMLINTSRGGLVASGDLIAALNTGRLAGAALDVLEHEPPIAGDLLLTARNCTITPHVAWAARAARRRLLATAVDNIRHFLAGNPRNVVN
jgi:glycerate dehydrogenase